MKKALPAFLRAESSGTLVIRSSVIHQRGTFAAQAIQKGDFIQRMGGEIVSFKEILRRIRSGALNPDDPLQIDVDEFIDLNPASMAINHSCNPNAGIRGKGELIAIRDISKGEEVTYDYSTTVSVHVPPSSWSMTCTCHSEKCRKIISNVLTVPEDTLSEYVQLDVLPAYILGELSGRL